MNIASKNRKNATASWHGYSHQGKVGIYLALRKIAELMNEYPNLEKFSDYSLVYEMGEDVDLRYRNDVLSRHQIKAKRDGKYRSSYQDVLTDFDETDDDGRPIQITKKYLHVTVEVSNFYDPSQEEKYPNHSNVDLYEYPDGKLYCDVMDDSIKVHSLKCIEKIMLNSASREPNENSNRNEYIEMLYYLLINQLDREIITSYSSQVYPIIKFSLIVKKIIKNIEVEDILIAELKYFLIEILDDFIKDLKDSFENGIDYNQLLKVRKYVNDITDLNKKEFIEFLLKINPEMDENETTIDYQKAFSLTDVTGFKEIFFDLLYEVLEEELELDYPGYSVGGGYYLTLLNRKKKYILSNIKKIANNSEISSNFFNQKYIINGSLDYYPVGGIINDLLNSEEPKNERYESIMYSDAKFINVESAVNKLNERRTHDE